MRVTVGRLARLSSHMVHGSVSNESVGHRAESGVKLLPENTVGSRGQICLICDYIDTYMI